MWKNHLCTKFGEKQLVWRRKNRLLDIKNFSFTREREEKIKECFEDKEVNFHYPENVAFMQKKSEYVRNDVTNSCLNDKLPLAGL